MSIISILDDTGTLGRGKPLVRKNHEKPDNLGVKMVNELDLGFIAIHMFADCRGKCGLGSLR